MWRPEGWKNPHYWPQYKLQAQSYHIYEAGADAMLKARDKYIQDQIEEIYNKAGDDTAFRCMIFALLFPDEEEK